jgi:hypothetical protein
MINFPSPPFILKKQKSIATKKLYKTFYITMNQKLAIGKILRCDECQKEKIIRAMFFHEKRGWVKSCLECLQSSFGKNLEETREIVLKPEEFCEKHNRPKKI